MRYYDALWRFAHGLVRSPAAAEEVVQDVFLTLWRGRADWEVTTSVRAWLYAAVRNRALQHLRHERVVARLADRATALGGDTRAPADVPAMSAPPPDAHASVEGQDLEAIVGRAIAALPERRRLAMTLRWNHGLSAPEIARALGTTPEAVRVLLTRARQELAALLESVRR